MKKTLALAILGAVAGVATSYGQGTVGFFNYFASTSPTINYSANAALVPAGKAGLALGGSFAAELGWFNGVTADPNQITLVASSLTYFSFNGPTANGTADGDVFNAAHPLGSGAGWYLGPNVSLTGTGVGSVVTLDVFVFNGGSIAAASVGGNSGLFQVTLGGGGVPPASLATAPNISVVNTGPVPEPSIFALAGLGAAGLMTLRRNKKA